MELFDMREQLGRKGYECCLIDDKYEHVLSTFADALEARAAEMVREAQQEVLEEVDRHLLSDQANGRFITIGECRADLAERVLYELNRKTERLKELEGQDDAG